MSHAELLDGSSVTGRGFVADANPVAKLVVATVISAGLLLTVDVVTAAAALLLELVALAWCGLSPGQLWRRCWIVVLAGVPAGVVTALLGVGSGAVLLPAGPFTVTQGSALAGAAITLRVLAIGLPGVVLLATTDPTDLAGALSQILRLPSTFVLSALASLRLVGVLGQEWRQLGMARRARGLGGGGRASAVPEAVDRAMALLVLAIRRGTVLASAMEARGFGASTTRTWARESRLLPRDGVVVLGGSAIIVLATAAGLFAGTWQLSLA